MDSLTNEAAEHLRGRVDENIANVAALVGTGKAQVSKHQRLVEKWTAFLGRPRTTYCVVVLVVGWTAGNWALLLFGARPFDPPPFFWLQGVLSAASIFLTSLVLTTQARERLWSERREHLDLQINLLAEQKLAKLVSLVEELRRDLPNVHNREDRLAAAMSQAVNPQAIAEALERQLETAMDETPAPADETKDESA